MSGKTKVTVLEDEPDNQAKSGQRLSVIRPPPPAYSFGMEGQEGIVAPPRNRWSVFKRPPPPNDNKAKEPIGENALKAANVSPPVKPLPPPRKDKSEKKVKPSEEENNEDNENNEQKEKAKKGFDPALKKKHGKSR